MIVPPAMKYEFDEFVLDCENRSLYYQSVKIPLFDQEFLVLTILVKNDGATVRKQDFAEISEKNLSDSISRLRKALKQYSPNKFIVTVPKVGYKFDVTVKGISVDTEQTGKTENEQLNEKGASRNQLTTKIFAKKWQLLAGLMLIALIGAIFYFFYLRNSSNREFFENPKIVVIPFNNLNRSSHTNYLGISFYHEIVKNLSAIPNYEVIQANEQKNDEDLQQKLIDYREKQNVDLAILGTYVISGDQIDISARLVSLANNKSVQTKSFTVQNQNTSAVARQTALTVINSLGLGGISEINYVVDPENIDETAYQEYLKGLKFSFQSRNLVAASHLEKATQIQPDFYSGWTLLASMYRVLASEGMNPEIDYYEKSIAAANTAKKLNPNYPQAGIILAGIEVERGNLEAALKEFKDLPKNEIYQAGKMRLGAMITRYGGLLDETAKFSQESVRLTPKANVFLAELYYLGKYEEFKKAFTPAIDEASWHSFYLGLMGLYQNDAVVMRKHLQNSVIYYAQDFRGKISQALLLQLDGKTDEGMRILEDVERTVDSQKYLDGETVYYLVIAYSYLGNKEGTLRAFKKAVENGFFCYPYFAQDPMLDKFRNDSRFQEVIEISRQKHLKFKEIFESEFPK